MLSLHLPDHSPRIIKANAQRMIQYIPNLWTDQDQEDAVAGAAADATSVDPLDRHGR